MVRTASIDQGALLDAVRAVSAAETPDEVGRVAIERIAALVPSTVVTLNEVDPAARRARLLSEPAPVPYPDMAIDVWAQIASEHPLIVHLERTGDGSARRISDFWTRDEFHRSVVYRELYGPMGIEHQMSITLPEPRPIIVGIALSRSTDDFDERDRAILNLLRPHLAQAWRHARAASHLRALLAASVDALTTDEAGLVLLGDAPGEVTPGALVQLYRFFGRPGRHDPFPARVEQWLGRERTRLAGDRPALATTLTAAADGQRLTLRYLPATELHREAILLRTTDGPTPSAPDLTALGLSSREVEVLQLAGSGDSNAALAQRLGLAPATVKKHLENIYAKLGVRTRGQAVALLRETFTTHR